MYLIFSFLTLCASDLLYSPKLKVFLLKYQDLFFLLTKMDVAVTSSERVVTSHTLHFLVFCLECVLPSSRSLYSQFAENGIIIMGTIQGRRLDSRTL